MNSKVLTNGHYDKPLVSTNQKNVKGAHLAQEWRPVASGMQACGLTAAHCSLHDLQGLSTVLPQNPRQGPLLKQVVLPLLVPSAGITVDK